MGPKKINKKNTTETKGKRGRPKKVDNPKDVSDDSSEKSFDFNPSDNYNFEYSYLPKYDAKAKKKYIELLDKKTLVQPDDPLFSDVKKVKKEAIAVIEYCYMAWLVRQDFIVCKRIFDKENIIFIDRNDMSDSDGFYGVATHIYSFWEEYDKKGILMDNHVVEGNRLYYRAKRKDGTTFDSYIEFRLRPNMMIYKIDTGPLSDDEPDHFVGIPPKDYPQGLEEDVQLKPLPMWDPEYQLQEEKGTLYAMMFKLYRVWLLNQDVDQMKRLMAKRMVLEDRELHREFSDGTDCAHYFFTFVAHHYTTGIQVKQYKIRKNELFIRLHWPEKKKTTDIWLRARLNKDNMFNEFIFRKAREDVFTEPGDLKAESLKDLENVYDRKNDDENREKEDFASAINHNLDPNEENILHGTFSTSDTDYYLEDRIINKEPIQIMERKDIYFSPKIPFRLMFNISSGSDKDDLFTRRYSDKTSSSKSSTSFSSTTSEENDKKPKKVIKNQVQKVGKKVK